MQPVMAHTSARHGQLLVSWSLQCSARGCPGVVPQAWRSVPWHCMQWVQLSMPHLQVDHASTVQVIVCQHVNQDRPFVRS
jgi:hypothetical protein